MSSDKRYLSNTSDTLLRAHDVEPDPQSMVHQAYSAIMATAVLTVLCCGVYPLAVWGASQIAFPHQANGSLLGRDGAPVKEPSKAVGSALIGQTFSGNHYFHSRPSSAGAGYDGGASSGSNLGPLSDKLINGVVTKDEKGVESVAFDGVRLRTLKYALENSISFTPSQSLDGFKGADGKLDDIQLINAFPHANDPAKKKTLTLAGFLKPIPADAVTASGSGLDPHVSPANAANQVQRVAKARGLSESEVAKLVERHTARASLGILGDDGVNVLQLNLALDRLKGVPVSQP